MKGELSINPNDRSTPIGALCFARWEIARHLLADVVHVDLADGTIQDVAQELVESGARSKVQSSDISTDVQPFMAALFDALDRSVSEAATSGRAVNVVAASHFDFEKFPGASAYSVAAGKEAGCLHP